MTNVIYWSFDVRVDMGLDCTIVQQLPSKITCVIYVNNYYTKRGRNRISDLILPITLSKYIEYRYYNIGNLYNSKPYCLCYNKYEKLCTPICV